MCYYNDEDATNDQLEEQYCEWLEETCKCNSIEECECKSFEEWLDSLPEREYDEEEELA